MLHSELRASLKEQIDHQIKIAEGFKKMDEAQLNYRPGPEKWSVVQCLEHLNLYFEFYVPECRSRLESGKSLQSDKPIKHGWLGNYFAKSMLPKPGMKTMTTFKDKEPPSDLTKKVIDDFIAHSKAYKELLVKHHNKDLNRTKTNITITKLIKLKIGDTFRFILNHNERHLHQAANVLKSAPATAPANAL